MKQAITHPWALSETEAIALQRQFALRVERSDRLNPVETVAGVDVAYDQHSNKLVAAVVVLNASTFDIVASATADQRQH